ncbi:MAG: aminomethyl-transferring glycine dehydrogenase subunit GcvPB [Leptospiraceae bacterium]|nr:aminomethyl-transferring glycine dehydrogenase subunit GcvPB [Leptospiraceae bacterium]MDW8306249.1 aminomethyl-transferring glycine dehydrogenase subunit GcvPB [Leptospiraceae bacterium]
MAQRSLKVLRREKLLCEYTGSSSVREKNFPKLSEVELMRHYYRLAQQNYSWEDGLYPLGSCTMKYNPVLGDQLAQNEIFAKLSPNLPEELSQGALALIYETEEMLARLLDMPKVTLFPAAGAHGELSGVLMIAKYFADKKEKRSVILIPDSAHGTNPASAAMAGFEVVKVGSRKDGLTDMEELGRLVGPHVAAFMLTNPNTLGIFEEQILEIKALLEKSGALLYIDGANFNALMGKVSMGAMGADLVQLNLHKSFSTPHGGGGPGQGALAVSERLLSYLPAPQIGCQEEKGHRRYYYYEPPNTIGRIKAYYGHFANILRAWAYMKSYGNRIHEVAEHAVLNANYLRKRLTNLFQLASPKPTMHEVVFDDKKLREKNTTTMQLAKALLDAGFYAPTVYFPLNVSGAIMIEPTETETKEELDAFSEAIEDFLKEEGQVSHPQYTFVKEVDEAKAARNPILSWIDASTCQQSENP